MCTSGLVCVYVVNACIRWMYRCLYMCACVCMYVHMCVFVRACVHVCVRVRVSYCLGHIMRLALAGVIELRPLDDVDFIRAISIISSFIRRHHCSQQITYWDHFTNTTLCSDSWMVCRSVVDWVSWLVGHLVGLPVGCLICWLSGWLAGGSVGQ